MNRYKLTMQVECVVEAPDKETAGSLMAELPLNEAWWLAKDSAVEEAKTEAIKHAKSSGVLHYWETELKHYLETEGEEN